MDRPKFAGEPKTRSTWGLALLAAAAVLGLVLWVLHASGSIAPSPLQPAGNVSAMAAGSEFAEKPVADRLPIVAPSPETSGRSKWTQACMVTGRVLDPHRNPVAGAKVSLSSSSCESSAAGVFECSVECAYGLTYRATVLAQGFLLREFAVHRLMPPAFNLGEIVLDTGARVSGRVLDDSGNPVAGAKIEFIRKTDVGYSWNEPGTVVGQSGNDGSFTLENMPSDGICLAAEKGTLHSDWTACITIPPDGAASGIELHMQPALLVRGRVRDRASGAPLSAAVRITSSPGRWSVETNSGADGEFSAWAGRPYSSVVCMARAPGHTPNGTGTDVGPPGSAVEYLTCDLYPIAPVDFIVEDQATRAPLPRAELAWIPAELGEPQNLNPRLFDALASSASADDRGRIHIDAPPIDHWNAVIRAPAYAPRVCVFQELTASGAHVELSVGGAIEVQAFAGRIPAFGVHLELYAGFNSGDGNPSSRRELPKDLRMLVASADTDSKGEASFRDLATLEYSIQVRDPLHASHPLPDVAVVAGQTSRVTVEVGSACSITGQILRDSLPVAAVVVFARDVDQHMRKTIESSDGPYVLETAHAYTSVSDPEGRYRIEGLPCGAYAVATLGQDLDYDTSHLETPKPTRVALAEGQTRECDIELDPTVTIRGTVSVNGHPRYGMQVRYETHRNREGEIRRMTRNCLTDSAGQYALILPAGTTGNLAVLDVAETWGGVELAERVNLAASERDAPLDIDITAGSVRLEFVRNGESASVPAASRVVLRPKAEGGGVLGFSKDKQWYVSPRLGGQYAEWTLPVGSFTAYSETIGVERGPDALLTVRRDETAVVKLEIGAAK